MRPGSMNAWKRFGDRTPAGVPEDVWSGPASSSSTDRSGSSDSRAGERGTGRARADDHHVVAIRHHAPSPRCLSQIVGRHQGTPVVARRPRSGAAPADRRCRQRTPRARRSSTLAGSDRRSATTTRPRRSEGTVCGRLRARRATGSRTRSPRSRRVPRIRHGAPTRALRARARAASCARRARCIPRGSCGTRASSARRARAACAGTAASVVPGSDTRLRAPSPRAACPTAAAPGCLPTARCRRAAARPRTCRCANAGRRPAPAGTRRPARLRSDPGVYCPRTASVSGLICFTALSTSTL